MAESLTTILQCRNETHGDYLDTANYCYNIHNYLMKGLAFRDLAGQLPLFAHTIYMICLKLVRISYGNPREIDHWRDIQGYCELLIKEIEEYDQDSHSNT